MEFITSPLAPSSPSILIIQQICPAVTLAPVFLANLAKWAISQNREKLTVLFDAVNLKVMSMHEWVIWLDDCSQGEMHSNVSPSPAVLDTPTDDSPASTNVAPSTPTLNSIAASVSPFDPFFFWCHQTMGLILVDVPNFHFNTDWFYFWSKVFQLHFINIDIIISSSRWRQGSRRRWWCPHFSWQEVSFGKTANCRIKIRCALSIKGRAQNYPCRTGYWHISVIHQWKRGLSRKLM